ncbi:MAG: sensor histidine kinase [Verrucomicrobiota bacterium]
MEIRTLAYGRQDYKVTPQPASQPSVAPSSDAERVHRYAAISLPQKGWPVTASFDFPLGAPRWAVRLRYKLEGYDADWRDLDQNYMHLVVKFLDDKYNPISRAEFRASGPSAGWTGNLASSRKNIRTEQTIVPARSAWMSIWVDSGGHDETAGAWLVDNLSVVEMMPMDSPAKVLFEENFENGRDLSQPQGNFTRWVRDAGDLGGALVWQDTLSPSNHALLIIDSNPRDYSAWRLNDRSLIRTVPGQNLGLQWEEAFSIGRGRGGQATYPDLPSGHYQFRIQEVNALGVPTGEEAVLPLVIEPPYYSNVWFQIAAVLSCLALGLGVERFVARTRNRRKLELLERKQAVQQERARIARDIHDDLGTVLSRIAMVSESAALEAQPGSRQEQRLNEICDASRQLTRTMEEIVWAQDPKRDYLDNLVDYFCSFASNLLADSQISCRLNIPVDLPEIPLEAQKRHELFLVFKEALNNVIKHAGASEVRISLQSLRDSIQILIEDNGRGFLPSDSAFSKGNGLANMRSRLQHVGGQVEVHSEPGKGTHIKILLPVGPQPETTKPI